MPGAPQNVLWPLEPHTQAKHAILRKYLQAWYPIMASWNGRIIFLDGFAGPGEYTGGESGSPLIAIDTLLDHTYASTHAKEVVFFFVEKDAKRRLHLDGLLAKRKLPEFVKYEVREGAFDETLTEVLDHLEEQSFRLAPTFAFVDPFGFSDTPMRTIARLMAHPKCEVLVNFMYENINRFLTFANDAIEAHYDTLFGTDKWRAVDVKRLAPQDRERRIHDLYQEQLRAVGGATYVRSFRMRNKMNKTEYYLFFGTKSLMGLDKMKQAMWAVDGSGAYDFSDYTDTGQPVLFKPEPDLLILKRMLQDRFRGQVVLLRSIRDYVIAETPFHSGQYKRGVLKPEEQAGEIKVLQCSATRKAYTYPDKDLDIMKLHFL